MSEFFEAVWKHSPGLAVGLLIIYSLALTCFAIYKLIISIYFDAKKDYLTKLSTYCENISEIVAKIAIAGAYPAILIKQFWEYYYGKLILVEDEALEGAMVELGDVLQVIDEENYQEWRAELEAGALAVSGACRDLMKKTWMLSIVPWKDLQRRRK
jgi:hypothetical protein